MKLKSVQFLAILLTALALVPGAAHLLAMPNKIEMPATSYFIAQDAYRGWALLAVFVIGALLANLALTWLVKDQQAPFLFALLAFLCIVASLTIFFAWTYPTNLATNNWTIIPANWADLRRDWEYSHAVNAAVTFIALCAAVLAAITTHRPTTGVER